MIRKTIYKPSNLFKLIIICIVFCFVLLPIIKMLVYIDRYNLVKLFKSAQFYTSLFNSLFVSSVTTIISLIIAFILALCVSRTNIRYKGIFSIIMVIPMLIPSISHSTGLIILFGRNGLITNLLGLNFSIYGFWGIVFGSALYSLPYAFLMIFDVIKYENYAPYEAANILGIPKKNQLAIITVPYLRKPLISIIFATFSMVFTDYGVPLAIGGRFTTLPVLMYQEVIGQLNFSKGSIIGLVLLFPAVIAFVFDTINKDRAGSSYITTDFRIEKNRLRDLFAYTVCVLITLIIVLIISSFIILTFTNNYPIDLSLTLNNIKKTFNMNGVQYLANSLLIGIIVTIIGVAFSFIAAYYTSRMTSKLTKALHLFSITSMAIPGIVLGLSYVLLFKGSIIYGTIIILIIVNIVHFTASPYLMMYNTLGKINENLENVGQTLGIPRIKVIFDIIIPQVKTTLLEMGSYLFVNSMITISAVSFLATTENKPFSLMINQFEALMIIECSAVVSLILLVINILIKGTVYLIRLYWNRRARFANGN